MSLKPIDPSARPSAEMAYRAAFERLMRGKPERLPKGTPVSQNNVAKEAGSDPSALKKSRFPSLIAEIQRYVAERGGKGPVSDRQKRLAQRMHNRDLSARIEKVTKQRDEMACLLNEANAKIIELSERVAVLEAKIPGSNIISMPRQNFT